MYLFVLGFFCRYVILTGQSNLSINLRVRLTDTLIGAKYFTKLDLRTGYWQVEMGEADKAKTAFSVGNLGFYECNGMAFGLTNAHAIFQRLMEHCMEEINLHECLIFLDDIHVLVFSQNFEEHLGSLEAVFSRLTNGTGDGPDPAEDRTRDPPHAKRTLYHFAIKAGFYRKAVQVCYIPIPCDITTPLLSI